MIFQANLQRLLSGSSYLSLSHCLNESYLLLFNGILYKRVTTKNYKRKNVN